MISARRHTDTTSPALICDPLTAYRRDLERVGDIVRFGSSDDRWLSVALRLDHLVAARALRATPVRDLAKHTLLRPRRLLALTERIEAAGALVLSFNMLESARRAWDLSDPPSAGMALFRQARICRTMGDLERAAHFYAGAIRLAVRRRLSDLRGQALVGRGVMHGMAGDLPSAYRAFAQARALARQTPDVIGRSYLGEMAAALAHGDLSRAIVAGSQALRATPISGVTEASVLINIAAIALRAQQPRAAGMALRRAMQRSRHPRLRLHIFAKSAMVAAALGRREEVAQWARRATTAATRVNVPGDELEARSELAQAFALIGETARARRLARVVRAQARSFGLTIVVQRCDEVLKERLPTLPPVRLNRSARQAISAFEVV